MRYFSGPPFNVDYAKVCSRLFGAALILCCDWASAFGAEAVNKTTTDAGSHKSAIGRGCVKTQNRSLGIVSKLGEFSVEASC